MIQNFQARCIPYLALSGPSAAGQRPQSACTQGFREDVRFQGTASPPPDGRCKWSHYPVKDFFAAIVHLPNKKKQDPPWNCLFLPTRRGSGLRYGFGFPVGCNPVPTAHKGTRKITRRRGRYRLRIGVAGGWCGIHRQVQSEARTSAIRTLVTSRAKAFCTSSSSK